MEGERAVAGAGAIGVRRLGVDGLELEMVGAGVVVLRRVGVDGLEFERAVEVLELEFELVEGI